MNFVMFTYVGEQGVAEWPALGTDGNGVEVRPTGSST